MGSDGGWVSMVDECRWWMGGDGGWVTMVAMVAMVDGCDGGCWHGGWWR